MGIENKVETVEIEKVETVEIDNSNPFNKGVSYKLFLKELKSRITFCRVCPRIICVKFRVSGQS